MKKRTILIPVDLENQAEEPFLFIEKLDESKGPEIDVYLLHVVQYPVLPGNFVPPSDYVGKFYDELSEVRKGELEALGENMRLKNVNVISHTISSPGKDVSEEIAEYANKIGADLVVLNSRHRKGLDSLFIGTNLLRMVRACSRPMLILSKGQVPGMHRIAYATDFSEQSAKVFGHLQSIAAPFGAGILAFRVNTIDEFTDQRKFAEDRNAFINQVGIVGSPEIDLYCDWTLERGILHYAEDNAADIIAVATHARKGVARLISGSVTENLIRMTDYPLLVINQSRL